MQTFRGGRKLWLLAGLFTSACADNSLLSPRETARAFPETRTEALAALDCQGVATTGVITCRKEGAQSGANRTYIVGGQDVNVRLQSAFVSYDALDARLEVDVTVQNLMADAMGSLDGTTLAPNGVRVFFHEEPTRTSGTGTVGLRNPTGTATFTASDQAYYQWDEVLSPQEVSTAKRWIFTVNSDATFQFKLYVQAQMQARLVISEIMANPSAVLDNVGEWLEVYNAGRMDVNLSGWTILSNSPQSHVITPSAATCGVSGCTVIVPRGGYVVLANNRDAATNGGVPVDYKWPDGTAAGQINLSNGSATEFVALVSPGGVEVERVTTGSTTAIPNGSSRCLADLAADNGLLTNAAWQTSTTAWSGSAGDRGSPQAANSGCGASPAAGPITSVTVTPSPTSVAVGATRTFTATGRDANGVTATSTYTWVSSDPAIATVNASTGVATGVASGSVTITATSANGIAGTATLSVIEEFSSANYRNNLEFGTPTDADASDDIIITRPQFAVSYSNLRGGPNWVAWNLNKTHFGAANRCDCFAPDPLLPPGNKVVVTGDYTGSGYSRGHMVMSEQRTTTATENEITFYTTNILPQLQDMNGGPWLKFEVENNDWARINDFEMYIYSGGIYPASPATLNNAGKVQIPSSTWKIVVRLAAGKRTLADVVTASDITVYSVNMPNAAGIQANDWPMYVTSVDALEAATGYDFLASLPDDIETAVEAATSPTSFMAPATTARGSLSPRTASSMVRTPARATAPAARALRQ